MKIVFNVGDVGDVGNFFVGEEGTMSSYMSHKGYVNPQLLITPKELSARLQSQSICIVDARPTHEYAAGHIPKAVHLDLYGITLSDTKSEAFDAFINMIAYLFQARGIDSKKTVVFYENISGIRAARGFWFAEYMGHQDVVVLDGGIKAWLAEGGTLSTECSAPLEAEFELDPKPETHVNADEILASLRKEGLAILDTRSADEHYGRVARAKRAGAIPKSIHIEWLNNLDKNGAFKPAAELRAIYEAAGITPEKEIVCY